MVSFPIAQRAFGRGGGNWSSCPICDVRRTAGRDARQVPEVTEKKRALQTCVSGWHFAVRSRREHLEEAAPMPGTKGEIIGFG